MRNSSWSIFATLLVLVGATWAWADEQKSPPAKPEQSNEEEGVEARMTRRGEAFKAAMEAKDFDKALAILDEIVKDKETPEDVRAKMPLARFQVRIQKFQAAMAKKDVDKALAVLDEALQDTKLPKDLRVSAIFTQFQMLMEKKGDGAKACPLAKQLSEMCKDKPEVLNGLAWIILDTPNVKNRDLDLALTIAKQAAELSKYGDPAILDTLARAYFENNDLDKAIEFQTKAVEKLKDNSARPADEQLPADTLAKMKKTLEKYQAKKNAKK
jgi:uncharacterized protein (UPF0147 family)